MIESSAASLGCPPRSLSCLLLLSSRPIARPDIKLRQSLRHLLVYTSPTDAHDFLALLSKQQIDGMRSERLIDDSELVVGSKSARSASKLKCCQIEKGTIGARLFVLIALTRTVFKLRNERRGDDERDGLGHARCGWGGESWCASGVLLSPCVYSSLSGLSSLGFAHSTCRMRFAYPCPLSLSMAACPSLRFVKLMNAKPRDSPV